MLTMLEDDDNFTNADLLSDSDLIDEYSGPKDGGGIAEC